MFLNFELKYVDTYFIPHPRQMTISDQQDLTFSYNIPLESAPDGFWKWVEFPEDSDTWIPQLLVFSGWRNLPKWQFDQELYDAGEFPFIPFDPDVLEERILHVERRERITARIAGNFTPDTELKKIRKALKAVIAALPELGELPEVQEFQEYSDQIEHHISHFPKDGVGLLTTIQER